MVYLNSSSAQLVVDTLNILQKEVEAAKQQIRVEDGNGTLCLSLRAMASAKQPSSELTIPSPTQFRKFSRPSYNNTMESSNRSKTSRFSGHSLIDKLSSGPSKTLV
jgi:hypothetical protein